MAVLLDLIGWLLFCAGFCAAYIGVVYFPVKAKGYMEALGKLILSSVGGWMAMSTAVFIGYGQEWFIQRASVEFGGTLILVGAFIAWRKFLKQTYSP